MHRSLLDQHRALVDQVDQRQDVHHAHVEELLEVLQVLQALFLLPLHQDLPLEPRLQLGYLSTSWQLPDAHPAHV